MDKSLLIRSVIDYANTITCFSKCANTLAKLNRNYFLKFYEDHLIKARLYPRGMLQRQKVRRIRIRRRMSNIKKGREKENGL